MDRESMQRLKFDRRLIGRRKWISADDLERELSKLPDVSDKIAPNEPISEGEAPEVAGSSSETATGQ